MWVVPETKEPHILAPESYMASCMCFELDLQRSEEVAVSVYHLCRQTEQSLLLMRFGSLVSVLDSLGFFLP